MPGYRATIEPLDPLLFGDSRSARAGLDHRVTDQDPSPATLFGAVGQHLLSLASPSPGPWPDALLGPRWKSDLLDAPDDGSVLRLLALAWRDAEGELLFPRPRHLRWRRLGGAELLVPRAELATWSSVPFPELLVASAAEERSDGELVSRGDLSAVLCGSTPAGAEPRRQGDLLRSEPRPGIAIDPGSGLVVESLFFTRPYRRFRGAPAGAGGVLGAGLEVWFETPGAVAPAHLAGPVPGFVGGDRRRARITIVPEEGPPFADLRDQVAACAGDAQGPFVCLLTPMPAPPDPSGVLFPGPAGAAMRPVAAALGKPRQVSGWDGAARAPRPLVALCPEGSVFFYRWPKGCGDRAQLVRDAWLAPLGRGGAAGFGRVLVGVWR